MIAVMEWKKTYPGDEIFLSGLTDIWRIHVGNDLKIFSDDYARLLTKEERVKANGFNKRIDEYLYLTTRIGLKLILSKYLQCGLDEIKIIQHPFQKPFIHQKLKFNVSHSGNWSLLAFSNKEVGVDVELMENDFQYQEIMHHSFDEKEIDFIKRNEKPIEAFYEIWTRKEALLKKTGRGISDGSLKQDSLANPIATSFKLDEEHIASIATEGTLGNYRELSFS